MLAGDDRQKVLKSEALALVGLVLLGREPERDLFDLLEESSAAAVLEPQDELEAGIDRAPLRPEVHLFRLDRPVDEGLAAFPEHLDLEGALEIIVRVLRLDVILVGHVRLGVGVREFLLREAADGGDDGVGGK